ncbi:ABC transporter permease [Aureibacter tunicatorum]|uniref:ABC-2 type transport system permease protein n=1 Tax=Aureibacter tunicatorum TaxID=866807 RepID=A0AAE3XU37_9BACT|nr:DUF3526 domain-containing protein [Aureibacter tunicatorum]MDR6242025.1 ABC-2 type transport system permease protein [Aureibacter tunicatorum]BDD07130.1 hypothetical protein AUTU_46130 [Aureibacter tunicatorum]
MHLLIKELQSYRRNKFLLCVLFAMEALLIFSLFNSYFIHHKNLESTIEAQGKQRKEWLSQGEKHPHMAAHFGYFAYKPVSVLSFFDPGVNAYTGTYNYLEAHRQNDLQFSPVQDSGATVRFGELSVSMLLQIVLPLLIIFMGYSSVNQERSSGILKFAISQGASMRGIVYSKIFSLFISVVILLLPVFLAMLIFLFLESSFRLDALMRWGGLMLSYGLYALIIACITVIVSALNSNRMVSMIILLSIWMGAVVLSPKMITNWADLSYPLPSQHSFNQEVRESIKQGINGHNDKGERAQKLKAELLKKHNVDSVHKLPFNFQGYVMQAGEEYSSKVYDHHFHFLEAQLDKQDKMGSSASLANPFVALRNLSMAFSATDVDAHFSFQRYAENYRRDFVKQMNQDMMYSSTYGDWEYKAGHHLWEKLPAFEYQSLDMFSILKARHLELLSLLIWTLILVGSVFALSSYFKILS